MKIDNYDQILDELAKIGYENTFEESWESLPKNSIEKAHWKQIAFMMVKRLRELFYGDKFEKQEELEKPPRKPSRKRV